MRLRRYRPTDLTELLTLFRATVHTVNARDYTAAQLDVWAPAHIDSDRWNRTLQAHETFVALEGSHLIGFGDIDQTGYLDRLYVHWAHQRQGVATALCDALERCVQAERLYTHASLTARPFFEARGYRVIRAQQVVRQGISLTNFVMEKERPMKQIPTETAAICGLFCGSCPSYPDVCGGCLSDRVAPGCDDCANGFRDCAATHRVTRCYECTDFPCARLDRFRRKHIVNGICHHAHVIDDLRRMQQIGVESWVAEQQRAHTCANCGKLIPWFAHRCPGCTR